MARVLAVQHAASCPPGRLRRWLTAAGVDVDMVHPYAGQPVPPLETYDGLLVLGGAMGARDDHLAPWLPAVRDRLRAAVAAQLPTLGVCLGGQLLALACGGEVARGRAGLEVGVFDVEPLAAATDDPLMSELTSPRPVLQWHADEVVRLPAGAVPLMTGATYPQQAFRVGPAAWGVQFHPEVDAGLIEPWAEEDRDHLSGSGIDPAAVVAQVAARDAELEAAWQPLGGRFAALVAGRA